MGCGSSAPIIEQYIDMFLLNLEPTDDSELAIIKQKAKEVCRIVKDVNSQLHS